MISSKMSYTGDIEIQGNRSSDVLRHNGSSKKLKTLIEQEVTDFDIALDKTIEWYLGQKI